MKKKLIPIQKIKNDSSILCEDAVALEAVYSVFVNDRESFRVSCTPENIRELVLGRLYTEGMAVCLDQAEEIQILEETHKIYVKLNQTFVRETKKAEDQEVFCHSGIVLQASRLFAVADQIFDMPGELFRETGCAHSCAFWKQGQILCRFEDIGRHNALDKVVGSMLLQGIFPENGVIFTSGRISSDYLMKVIASGVKTVVSRSAVTSEAAALAQSHGITMYGFVRSGRGNLYSP